jgi:flagellin
MSVATINSNGNSMWARYGVASIERDLDRAMIQLSTGKRTSSSAIDAAGIGIASRLQSEQRGFAQAARNAFDGASLALAADAALDEIGDLLQRQRELLVEKTAGTLTTAQTSDIAVEVGELQTAIALIGAAAQWNGSAIFGSTYTIGAGQDGADTYTFAASSIAGVASNAAVSAVDTALVSLANFRAKLGAAVNVLTGVGENMLATAAAAAESRGRVEDTDYAEATAQLARAQIIQQAATAMVAQANQQPSSVLALLRN